jgi:hypothetical protein
MDNLDESKGQGNTPQQSEQPSKLNGSDDDQNHEHHAPQNPIQAAIAKLNEDPGAIFDQYILLAIRQLRTSNPAEFARIRQQVKTSGQVQMTMFDQLTSQKATDEETSDVDRKFNLSKMIEPWHTPVSGAELLEDITEAIRRYIICDKETARATALWCVMTWLVDVISVCPIANITAPEKRCGKSTLLSIIQRLARKALPSSGISPSALFRSLEKWQPTLIIDEVDTFLSENEGARGILNAGFTRDQAYIIRCEGDDHEPKPFNVWGAKALCGIGKIADTLADRSIPLNLRRKLSDEKAERLRHSDPGMWETLRRQIASFADDVAEQINTARPAEIEGLNDRANDCWEPLLAIAEAAGGDWPAYARQAAIALHGLEEETPTIGVELLMDIKSVFDRRGANKIFTADLLAALMEDEEAPWSSWNRGKPMTDRQLAKRLKDYNIKSADQRIGLEHKKGYDKNQFTDAWKRYTTRTPPVVSTTPRQPTNGAACSDFSRATDTSDDADKKTLQLTDDAACRGVADKKGGSSGVWGCDS